MGIGRSKIEFENEMAYITLPYDPEWPALAWAKKYCPSYITNNFHKARYNGNLTGEINYFFSDERDAVLFALRWL